MKRLFPFLLSGCLLVSCSADNSPTSTNTKFPSEPTSPTVTQTPGPSAPQTPEAAKKENESVNQDEDAQQQKAFDEYLAKHYKGWTLSGTAGSSGPICNEHSPCDLHLTNGSQNKVVTVMMKLFFRKDGSRYWFVFEARGIDLTRNRIEDLKLEEREATLQDLTDEDCKNICDSLNAD